MVYEIGDTKIWLYGHVPRDIFISDSELLSLLVPVGNYLIGTTR